MVELLRKGYMETSEYRNIYTRERSHFFYVGNHNIVISLLRSYLKRNEQVTILDAGCGTGLLAKKLEKLGKVFAVDISSQALQFAKKRGVRAKRASVTKLPFRNNFFDCVVSIDVLYHRKVLSDRKALSEFYRVLKPGGIVIVRVPAHKWLRLSHDTHVHTRERYSKSELREKLRGSGFTIERISYINMLLFPLALLKQILEGIKPAKKTTSSIADVPKLINGVLSRLLSLETFFLRRTSLPIGIGLVAVCRKPV